MPGDTSSIGTCFGNYRVTAELGSGGFGNVYRGEHTILTERTVAIKRLHAHLSNPEERERFLQEARLLERLKHPSILHIFDVGIHEGFPYLVSEYAPHGSLRDLLKKYAPNPLPVNMALHILTQVGEALNHAHQQNIIHRDLKPENILFNAQGEALLADFGIATTLSTASIKNVTIIGTPSYMAPEQFQSSVSKESDQYALGCIAYELFTGQLPFAATDFFSMGFSHLSKPPIAPTQLNPHLPFYIEQAILKAMAKQRHDRHANINIFIEALHAPFDAQPSTPIQSVAHLAGGPITPVPAGLSTQASSINVAGAFNTIQSVTPPLSSLATLPSPEAKTTLLPTNPLPSPSMISGPAHERPFPVVEPSFYQTPPQTPLPITGGPKQFSIKASTNLAYPSRRRNIRRRWLLITVASFIVAVGLLGTLIFAFPSRSTPLSFSPSTSVVTQGANTASAFTPITTSTSLSHHAMLNPKPTAISTKTHGVPATPSHATPIVATPTQAATAAPTSAPTPKPTAIPTADPTPITDANMIAYFTAGATAVTTTHSYSGTVQITVSGVGQASQTQYSDAFYRYTDNYGNPTPPKHPTCWVLSINNQPTDNFLSIPAFDPSHNYSFTITAPGGPLTFGVCDPVTSDNTGSYTISVTQQ